MELVRNRQQCLECDWTGLTVARTVMLISWFTYVFAAIGVLIADAVLPNAHILSHVATQPVVVTVLAFTAMLNIVPPLFNRCPQCGGKRIVPSS
ncbi:MAG: hypothetical protein ACXVDA_26630 [Ktedonobacterales bacterium]